MATIFQAIRAIGATLGDSWCWDCWGLLGPVAFVDLEGSFAFVSGHGVVDAFVDEVFQNFVLDAGLDGQFLDDDVLLGHTFSVDESRFFKEAVDEALQKKFTLVVAKNVSIIKLTCAFSSRTEKSPNFNFLATS